MLPPQLSDPASASLPSCLCLQCTPDRLPGNILAQLETWMVQNQTLLESECLALPVLQPRSHISFLQQVSAVYGCHWVPTPALAEPDASH